MQLFKYALITFIFLNYFEIKCEGNTIFNLEGDLQDFKFYAKTKLPITCKIPSPFYYWKRTATYDCPDYTKGQPVSAFYNTRDINNNIIRRGFKFIPGNDVITLEPNQITYKNIWNQTGNAEIHSTQEPIEKNNIDHPLPDQYGVNARTRVYELKTLHPNDEYYTLGQLYPSFFINEKISCQKLDAVIGNLKYYSSNEGLNELAYQNPNEYRQTLENRSKETIANIDEMREIIFEHICK